MNAFTGEPGGAVESARVPESDRVVEPRLDLDSLPAREWRRRSVECDGDAAGACSAVDALDVDHDAASLGSPAQRRRGESTLDTCRRGQREPPDVVRRPRWRATRAPPRARPPPP